MVKSPTTQTHIVLKLEDCQKYLNPRELQELSEIIRNVSDGRKFDGKSDNEYLVVNVDEPYAPMLFRLIQTGEAKK